MPPAAISTLQPVIGGAEIGGAGKQFLALVGNLVANLPKSGATHNTSSIPERQASKSDKDRADAFAATVHLEAMRQVVMLFPQAAAPATPLPVQTDHSDSLPEETSGERKTAYASDSLPLMDSSALAREIIGRSVRPQTTYKTKPQQQGLPASPLVLTRWQSANIAHTSDPLPLMDSSAVARAIISRSVQPATTDEGMPQQQTLARLASGPHRPQSRNASPRQQDMPVTVQAIDDGVADENPPEPVLAANSKPQASETQEERTTTVRETEAPITSKRHGEVSSVPVVPDVPTPHQGFHEVVRVAPEVCSDNKAESSAPDQAPQARIPKQAEVEGRAPVGTATAARMDQPQASQTLRYDKEAPKTIDRKSAKDTAAPEFKLAPHSLADLETAPVPKPQASMKAVAFAAEIELGAEVKSSADPAKTGAARPITGATVATSENERGSSDPAPASVSAKDVYDVERNSSSTPNRPMMSSSSEKPSPFSSESKQETPPIKIAALHDIDGQPGPFPRQEQHSTLKHSEQGSSAGASREVSASAAVDPAPATAKAAVRDFVLRIPAGSQQHVDVHIVERAGKVHVTVRSTDPAVTTSLRTELSQLVQKLESHGLKTETWTPSESWPLPGGHPPEAVATQSGMQWSDFSEGHSQQQQNQQQERRRHGQQPDWLAELENELNEEE